MLSTKEIREYIRQELDPYFLKQGFAGNSKGDLLFSYHKDSEGIFYGSDGYLLTHNEHKLVYMFQFGLQKVTEILRQIDKHVPLKRNKYTIGNSLIGISPGSILFPKEPERPYKEFGTEPGLQLILFDIQAFHQGFFTGFCDKYSDIGQLNKLYNRIDDFRVNSLEFPNLAFFHVTRLVIARLANDPNFDEITDRNFQDLEDLWKKEGAVYDRSDEKKPEVFAAKFLKANSFE